MLRLRRSDVQQTDFDELFAPDRCLLRDDLEEGVEAMHSRRRWSGMFSVGLLEWLAHARMMASVQRPASSVSAYSALSMSN